jgi:hypothetical protein
LSGRTRSAQNEVIGGPGAYVAGIYARVNGYSVAISHECGYLTGSSMWTIGPNRPGGGSEVLGEKKSDKEGGIMDMLHG